MCPSINGAYLSCVQAKAKSTAGNCSTVAFTTNARATNLAKLPPNGKDNL